MLDAPSNLGLRPPEEGAVPGCYKAPWALRNHDLLRRLHANAVGVVVPPRYRAAWEPGGPVRNEEAIAKYSIRLADCLQVLVAEGSFPVVLGGDCSILLGNTLALARRGRYGLAFIDGHSDFRHLGNAPAVGAVAGEDLAVVTGRGGRLANLDGHRPYVRDEDVVVFSIRSDDECAAELDELANAMFDAATIELEGGESAARHGLAHLEKPGLDGFWIHLDVDVLDPQLMPAVDSPDPGGVSWESLEAVLTRLISSPLAVGLEVTVFDPDLDEDGALAARLAHLLERSLADLLGE